MNKLTGMISFTLGTGAALLGTALGAGTTPLTAGLFLGAALSGAGGGVAGNAAYDGLKGTHNVIARLRNSSKPGELPLNHDLVRAVRGSQLLALRYMVERLVQDARTQWTEFDQPTIKTFSAAATEWIEAELGHLDASVSNSDVQASEAMREIDRLIGDANSETALNTLRDLATLASKEMYAEFAEALRQKSVEVPGAFDDWFYAKQEEYAPGWLAAARAFFADRLKNDPRVRTIVFLELLNECRASANRTSLEITNIESILDHAIDDVRALAVELDAIRAAINELSRRTGQITPDTVIAALITALSRPDVAGALRRRIGVEAPPDRWAASRAAADVHSYLEELDRYFVGRRKEFDSLDAFVEENINGLLVVAAPAGGGKSALMLQWLRRRTSVGDIVVRHFINQRYSGTTDWADAARHLLAQFREVDSADPELTTSAIPTDTRELLDKLFSRLREDAPAGERLIVMVDGLDEAATKLRDTFVRERLGDRVFVVVAARAEAGTHPEYLRPWESAGKQGLKFERLDLPGLDVKEVLAWLEEVVGRLGPDEMRTMAEALERTTSGLPLFLRYVIEDLKTKVSAGDPHGDSVALVSQLPAPFSAYVADELERLRGENVWTEGTELLFGILSRLRGSIRIEELDDLFTWMRRQDVIAPAFPRIDQLDHRLTRWLAVRNWGPERSAAFTHPRLALAFSEALGRVGEKAEDRLIAWAKEAWRPVRETRGWRDGSDYALDQLPTHLLAHPATLEAAAALLADPDFLRARVRNTGFAARRFQRSADEWAALPSEVKNAASNGSWWTGWWGDNESGLRRAISSGPFGRTAALNVLCQVLADSRKGFLPGLDVSGEWWDSNGIAALLPQKPLLIGIIRAIDDAHHVVLYGIQGVLPFNDGIVSWGDDGAVRLWGPNGEPREGGGSGVHPDGVSGVILCRNGLISWGYEGDIQIWGSSGEALARIIRAHPHMPFRRSGVLIFGDNLVSWADDGAVRFWGLDGQRRDGGASDAHPGGVSDVVTVRDGLASWGGDRIRFWGPNGEAREPQIHALEIRGIVAFGDGVVSWGSDGAIRYWAPDGNLRHDVSNVFGPQFVSFLCPFRDGLVGWDYSGVLRFLGPAGELRGGAAVAPDGSVQGIFPYNDGLISWGSDGAIRFWGPAGEPRGGVPDAHRGRVYGVLPFKGELLSWGADGAIRFWGPNGEERNRIISSVHRSGVGGVLPLGDGLVTWGSDGDGSIRFWSPGAASDNAASEAHEGFIRGLTPFGQGWVSWGGDGSIQFWGSSGEHTGSILEAHSRYSYNRMTAALMAFFRTATAL